MRRIILPQAMRVIIPAMGNETISMLKTTSLLVVIAGHELMTNVQIVYSQTFQQIPLLIVASHLVSVLHHADDDRSALPRGVLRQGVRHGGDRGGRKARRAKGGEGAWLKILE